MFQINDGLHASQVIATSKSLNRLKLVQGKILEAYEAKYLIFTKPVTFESVGHLALLPAAQ